MIPLIKGKSTQSFNVFLILIVIVTFGCSSPQAFKSDCDLCQQVKQKEVETSLINFVYNDQSDHISKEAEIQILKIREKLHHGFKFTECGCKEDKLVFRLWCANDETYELEVKPIENNQFTITGIHPSVFTHP